MITLKEKVNKSLETTKIFVLRALRDFPELRNVSKRRELIKKVNELAEQDLYPDTITRLARHIQNTQGLYLVDDSRKELEQDYKDYFGK